MHEGVDAVGEVCLIVVFNHRYDKNIERLEKMYQKRFSNRYYLMPFYDGDVDNVIPVYECSYQFQGYLAQGYARFFHENYDHYIIIADDMIINPVIDEKNYRNFFKLDEHSGYISYWYPLSQWPCSFERVENALIAHALHKGVNAKEELPSGERAFSLAGEKGFHDYSFPRKAVFYEGLSKNIRYWTSSRSRFHLLGRILLGITNKLEYPYMNAYSDIFIVSAEAIKEFCRLCGIFAAMRLHVETAVPTALLLSQRKVVVNKDLGYRAHLMWELKQQEEIERKNDLKISNLIAHWEKDMVCLHPVKLSRWED